MELLEPMGKLETRLGKGVVLYVRFIIQEIFIPCSSTTLEEICCCFYPFVLASDVWEKNDSVPVALRGICVSTHLSTSYFRHGRSILWVTCWSLKNERLVE